MSTLEVKYQGKWRSFVIQDGRSGVLRRQANLDTGEIASFLDKQLQGRRLKRTSRTYLKVFDTSEKVCRVPFREDSGSSGSPYYQILSLQRR